MRLSAGNPFVEITSPELIRMSKLREGLTRTKLQAHKRICFVLTTNLLMPTRHDTASQANTADVRLEMLASGVHRGH